jgi:sulfotransferase
MELFFNSSMPRSGSEVLQVILHQNPAIYGSVTSPLLEYQFAARGNYMLPEVQAQNKELMATAFLSMCRGMAESYYAPITTRPYIIDKNRGWSHYWEWVNQWCPNPKMICMVRDLRSILASLERIYQANRFMPIGPDEPRELRNMTVTDRVTHWLNAAPVGLALRRTLDLIERGVAEKVLFVRYEDLCQYPQASLSRIYDYLELPSSFRYEHDFGNIKKEIEENDSLFSPYGSHKIEPILRGYRPKDWLPVLNNVTGIEDAARWYFEYFKYEV